MSRHPADEPARPRSPRATRFALGIAVCALALGTVQPTVADQITDKIQQDQQQQQHDQSDIAAKLADIASQQDREAKLKAIIAGLDAQIAATKAQVSAAQAELAQVTAALEATQAQLAEEKQRLAAEKKQLARELVVIYETENQSTPIANLLESGDFNSFWVQVIDDHRIGEIEQATVNRIDAERATIQAEVDQISADQQQKQATLNNLNSAEAQLSNQRNQQQADVDYLNRLIAEDQAAIQQREQEQNQLAAAIAALNAQEQAALSAGGGDGRFVWPESGPITQGFGCTSVSSELPASYYGITCPPSAPRYHNGIDIGAPWGNPIVAGDTGIAHLGCYDRGFGNCIFIVHGNGWDTLYGHMSGFAINDGQTVGRGQLIGWEGSTGNSTGPHLHFGVEHNGIWVNPLNYLP